MPKPSKETKQVEPQEDEARDAEAQADEEIENVECPDFSVEQLYFKAQEPNKDATQLMCFPKYIYDATQPLTPENFEKNGKSVIIVTKPIKMVRGGIPRHNTKFHGPDPDAMKRAYFYIPQNDKDPNSMELFDCIKRIDDYMHDEINVKGNESSVLCVLNSKGKRIKLKGGTITYTRMITTAKPGNELDLGEEDDEDDKPKKGKKGGKDAKDGKKEFVPWNRIKVRFSTEWDENLGPNDRKDINTQIYVGDNETAENCKTVSDFEKHFMWNCTAQFALMMNKVWIKKTDDKACSIGIKCVQIGVTEQPEFKKNTSVSKQLNKKLFPSAGPLKVSAAKKNDSTNDEENDENEENEDEENAKVSAKGSGKKSAKSTSEDKVKPTKGKTDTKTSAKTVGKTAKKADTEEEDAEEEDAEEAEDVEEDEKEENEDVSEPESEDEKPAKKNTSKADVKVRAKVSAGAKSGSDASGAKKPAKGKSAKGK